MNHYYTMEIIIRFVGCTDDQDLFAIERKIDKSCKKRKICFLLLRGRLISLLDLVEGSGLKFNA